MPGPRAGRYARTHGNDAPRRGRLPKAKVAEPERFVTPAAVAARPAVARNPRIFLRAWKSDEGPRLAIVDQRGEPVSPDYRRFEGALREFAAESSRARSVFVWNSGEKPFAEGIEPTERLVALGCEAGILVDEHYRPVAAAGSDRLVFAIATLDVGRVSARPLPLSALEEGCPATAADAAATGRDDLLARGPRHVLFRGRLCEVGDLGPEWRALDGEPALLKSADLPFLLSTLLSRFPGVEPWREGYTIQRGRARIVRPALLFREIDAYGYLHVRPFGYVEGFPPGFVEDGALSRVVEIDEAERTITVSDLLFSRIADEEFRLRVRQAGKRAQQAVFEDGGRLIFDPDFAGEFLSSTMRELMARFALFEADKLARYRIVTTRPKLRFRFSAGINYLGGEAQIEIGGELRDFDDFLLEYERDGYVTLADGARAYPESRDIERYRRLLTKVAKKAGKEKGRYAISEFDLPALEREAVIEAPDERWERAQAFFHGFNALAEDHTEAGPGIEGGELRGYQRYGVRWISWLAQHGRNGCLADEMGLGKTIQTIAALRLWRREAGARDEGPVLIVMPRSLLFNWQAEFARHAPEFRVVLHHGTERGDELPENGAACSLVVLTSYATLKERL